MLKINCQHFKNNKPKNTNSVKHKFSKNTNSRIQIQQKMRETDTLMIQCRDLLEEDKLEGLFRAYGISKPRTLDGIPFENAPAGPETPIFYVSVHRSFDLFYLTAVRRASITRISICILTVSGCFSVPQRCCLIRSQVCQSGAEVG
jgi:hypothetical protein